MSPTDPPWSETGRHSRCSSCPRSPRNLKHKDAPNQPAQQRRPLTAAVPLGADISFCPVLVTTIGIMLRPEVRYARADGGIAIAYSVVGDGPVTIVVVSPLISQLELGWEEPALEHFWS